MSASYILQIDEKIAALETEIEECRIAKRVLMSLDRSGATAPKQTIELKANSGPITIRKIGAAPAKKNRKGSTIENRAWGKQTRPRILGALVDENGLTSVEIAAKLGVLFGDSEYDRLLMLIYRMGDEKKLIRNDGRYRLNGKVERALDDANAAAVGQETGT